ncbi:MAG: glycosyltransferase family 4 protein [Calothrix sp. C42_A2020_038]|nr:glycosyltransferase family 4 protein [Calothrix sp. C42_A2020_038]
MRILLINDIGAATGGAELQMLSLRQGLRARGHDVRLFSSNLIPVEKSEFLADYSCFGTNTRLQVLSQTANPSAYLKLRRILQDFQPDVVHVRIFMGQLSPLILPLLQNVPCIYQMAMYRAICPKGTKTLPDGSPCQSRAGIACLRHSCMTPQSWAVLMLQRQLWLHWGSAFDSLVALSHGMKAKLEAEGISPVEVVYNGVPARPMRPPLSTPPTVAFAGRLVPEKGVGFLLQAFAPVAAQLPQARLVIAGQGPQEVALRILADELGILANVTWLGHVGREEMERHFDGAWVQVVPSLWEEPFGNVTTEAMMRGTAVIACAVGAQPEIVNDGKTGFLVAPNDVEALTAGLLRLLQNQNLAEQMGQAGHQRAITYFSEDRRTENFLAIYEELRAKYQYQLGWT